MRGEKSYGRYIAVSRISRRYTRRNSAYDYGVQYVAKTPNACSVIEIISEIEMSEAETPLILKTDELREKGVSAAEEMIWKYQGEGQFFGKIIEEYRLTINRENKIISNYTL